LREKVRTADVGTLTRREKQAGVVTRGHIQRFWEQPA
jgi:hypothetical protein